MVEFFDYLESIKPSLIKINIPDIIIFNKITMMPIKWIYSDKNSQIHFVYFRNTKLKSVIESFIDCIPKSSSDVFYLYLQ